MKTSTKCLKCGGERFYGHQRQYVDVIVTGDGDWIQNAGTDITDCDEPYGPFTCESCGEKYEYLPIDVSDAEILNDLMEATEGVNKDNLTVAFDDAVHDAFSQKAADINNGGTESQLRALIEELGADEVKKLIEEARTI